MAGGKTQAPSWASGKSSGSGGGTKAPSWATGVSSGSTDSGTKAPSWATGVSSGNKPTRGRPSSPPKPTHHGFFGSIVHALPRAASWESHVFGQGVKDVGNMLVQSPTAIEKIGEALYEAQPANVHHFGRSNYKPLEHLGGAYLHQFGQDIRHPLRHPGNTLFDLLPFASAGVRAALVGGEASSLLRAGDVTGAAKAVVSKPDLGPRELRYGDAVARGYYSRGSLSAVTQRAVDKALQSGEGTGGVRDLALQKRMGKWNDRAERVAASRARVAGVKLQAAGRKLSPAEQHALRIVAEEVPVPRRLQAATDRLAKATNAKAIARHQARIDLTNEAAQHLEHGPDGRPVFKAGEEKLAGIYDLLQKASGDRGEMLSNLGLMDKQAQEAARLKQARLAAGGKYLPPDEADALLATTEKMLTETERRAQEATDALKATRQGTTGTRQAASAATRAEAQAQRALKSGDFRETQKALDKADRNAERASTNRNKFYDSGMKADRVRGLLNRQERLAQIAWQRYQRGEIGEGNLARTQDRLARLQDTYEKHASALVRYRQADVEGAQAAVEQATHKQKLSDARTANYKNAAAIREKAAQAVRDAHIDQQKKLLALKDELQTLKTWRDNLVHAQSRINVERGTVIGADDINVTPEGTFVGNPVERGRLGQPKVGRPRRTFGHTRKLGSTKTSTGAATEHALGRHDTTNIVAERHAEAVRLSEIVRRVEQVKGAGSAVPRHADDVFVWTDKVASHERLDPAVRRFLDNPELMRQLPDAEQQSVLEKVKDATLQRGNWDADPDAAAQLKRAARDGKGMFVPKALLGNAGKYNPQLGTVGVRAFDSVNNAQKAGMVFLKANYPLIQTFSNAAMGIIHQGFAYPLNLKRAYTLSRAAGPDAAAMVDDIMGQGFLHNLGFQGQSRVAHITQRLAHFMSDSVDRPARRAAFLHEAAKAGFGTPEKLRALLENDANAHQLAEVAQRAKEAIVDYENLGPVEKSVIRRLVFVYPWQKGAMLYTGHFLRDHPVQAGVLSQLGEQGQAESQQTLGDVPWYLKGAIDVGGKLVNPSGVNFFQTPWQAAAALEGYATGNFDAPTGASFAGPTIGALIQALERRDDLGRRLKGNLAQNVFDLLVGSTPAVRAIESAIGHGSTSRTFPDPHDALWSFLFGGLHGRRYDPGALNRSAALSKSGR